MTMFDGLSDSELHALLIEADEIGEELRPDRLQSSEDKPNPKPLQLAREVAARIARRGLAAGSPLQHPEEVARFVNLQYAQLDQEVMGVLFIDVRNRLIDDQELFRGTINRCMVEPRPILRAALAAGAPGILLFHTHPSGDPTPSAEDFAFTERLKSAGEIVGVNLIDHVVCGSEGRHTSFRNIGAL